MLAITAPISLLIVPGRLIVSGDAVATANNLRASEWRFRIGIASELFHQAVVIFLAVALYRLLKPVDERHALLLLILGALVSVPIMFVNVLNQVAALILVGGPAFLSTFEKPQLDSLAYLFIRLHGQGITVASIFWGLWLFPFGMLVFRSGFIPRVFGLLLWIAGVAYLASAFCTLVVPQYAARVDQVALLLEIAEVPIIFWLVIWGAREKRPGAPAVASGHVTLT